MIILRQVFLDETFDKAPDLRPKWLHQKKEHHVVPCLDKLFDFFCTKRYSGFYAARTCNHFSSQAMQARFHPPQTDPTPRSRN